MAAPVARLLVGGGYRGPDLYSTEALPTERAEPGGPLETLELEVELLTRLISALTGKELKFVSPRKFLPRNSVRQPKLDSITRPGGGQGGERAGYGLIYEEHSSFYEAEHVSFSAKALVRGPRISWWRPTGRSGWVTTPQSS